MLDCIILQDGCSSCCTYVVGLVCLWLISTKEKQCRPAMEGGNQGTKGVLSGMIQEKVMLNVSLLWLQPI